MYIKVPLYQYFNSFVKIHKIIQYNTMPVPKLAWKELTGVEIRKLSLSVSSLISIFGLTSVQKIVLNQYKLSILALFTFKFLNFQWVNSTELKMISVSKLTKENKIYYNQVRMIGSSILFLIFVGYSEWKWVKIGPICLVWK